MSITALHFSRLLSCQRNSAARSTSESFTPCFGGNQMVGCSMLTSLALLHAGTPARPLGACRRRYRSFPAGCIRPFKSPTAISGRGTSGWQPSSGVANSSSSCCWQRPSRTSKAYTCYASRFGRCCHRTAACMIYKSMPHRHVCRRGCDDSDAQRAAYIVAAWPLLDIDSKHT